MAIILLCEECADNVTIHSIDPTKNLETSARQFGWMRTVEGWMCPLHSQRISDGDKSTSGSTQHSGENS